MTVKQTQCFSKPCLWQLDPTWCLQCFCSRVQSVQRRGPRRGHRESCSCGGGDGDKRTREIAILTDEKSTVFCTPSKMRHERDHRRQYYYTSVNVGYVRDAIVGPCSHTAVRNRAARIEIFSYPTSERDMTAIAENNWHEGGHCWQHE